MLHLILLLALVYCGEAFGQTDDTEQLILQGRQELEAGQAERAGLIFERILLEQPWMLGVWLDYALSLQQLGEDESARAIYRYLLLQNPPEYLIPWLKRQVQAEPSLIDGWQHGGAITLLAGRDSNLNRAPVASDLTLTLPSGAQAVLLLADASRAKAGTSHLARIDWQAARKGRGNGEWIVQATLNTRLAPGAGGQDYMQSSLGLSHGWKDASGHAYHAVVAANNLRYGGKDIQSTLRAGFYGGKHWLDGVQARCSANYGAELERSAHPAFRELDGQYLGIAASLGCNRNLSWQLLLRAGQDRARRQRAGGDQQRVELRGQLNGQLGAGSWVALTELSRLRDADGYSPLLSNNAARDIRRGLLKIEYQHPIAGSLHALASAEAYRQHSNLPLFATHGQAIWIGMRYLF